MAYRLRFDKSLQGEIRHVAGEQLDRAIAALTEQAGDPHEAIHDVRKCIKHVRALYRFACPEDGDFRTVENDRLRTLANSLAGLRDAAALVESASYLQGTRQSEEEQAAINRLEDCLVERRNRLATSEKPLTSLIEDAIRDCRTAKKRLKDLAIPAGRKKSARLLTEGWMDTSRKARKALEKCRKARASNASFHELRKRCQDRCMQAALVTNADPAEAGSLRAQAKALVQLLGHEHDLAGMSALLGKLKAISAGDKALLKVAIADQRKGLKAQAIRDATRLFAKDNEEDQHLLERIRSAAKTGE